MAAVSPPTSLRFEHRMADRPVLGIGRSRPRISWQVPSAPPDYTQAAYEVEVTRPT